MTLLEALELVASLVPGLGPAVRAIRLLRIAVRIAELWKTARKRHGRPFASLEHQEEAITETELLDLDSALDDLELEERAS